MIIILSSLIAHICVYNKYLFGLVEKTRMCAIFLEEVAIALLLEILLHIRKLCTYTQTISGYDEHT